jgi:tripartite-type tricarboxylate transporter receptor subunit TctC
VGTVREIRKMLSMGQARLCPPCKFVPRRRLLQSALAAGVIAVSRIAQAQTYPARPVRLIVPFGSAGATDIVARLIGQWLSQRLGQSFVIENRPGAGGNIGIEAVVRSPPDGYTLALIGLPSAINVTLYDNLSYDFSRDIVPVASIVRFPNVMVVNPLVPAGTVPEFIAYAKAHPGKLNMSSPGAGSTPHVFGELFKMMAGVNIVHVPYRSVAAGMTDMLSGEVQVTFGTTASTIEYVRAGTLRALAVTTATRSQVLPELPTIAEFVPGYEASGWFGVGAPKNTPAEIVEKLNAAINACLEDPGLKARFADLGGTVLAGSSSEFAGLIGDEIAKWAKVVKFAAIKAE